MKTFMKRWALSTAVTLLVTGVFFHKVLFFTARQNLVEGSSRAGTSKETELRLYDVARGSLEELAGDYEAYLVGHGVSPWTAANPEAVRFKALRLDLYGGDMGENARHEYAEYLMGMRRRFAP